MQVPEAFPAVFSALLSSKRVSNVRAEFSAQFMVGHSVLASSEAVYGEYSPSASMTDHSDSEMSGSGIVNLAEPSEFSHVELSFLSNHLASHLNSAAWARIASRLVSSRRARFFTCIAMR